MDVDPSQPWSSSHALYIHRSAPPIIESRTHWPALKPRIHTDSYISFILKHTTSLIYSVVNPFHNHRIFYNNVYKYNEIYMCFGLCRDEIICF